MQGGGLTPAEDSEGQSALSSLWVLWMARQSERFISDSRAAQYCGRREEAASGPAGAPARGLDDTFRVWLGGLRGLVEVGLGGQRARGAL